MKHDITLKSGMDWRLIRMAAFLCSILLCGAVFSAQDVPTSTSALLNIPPRKPVESNQVRIHMKVLEWTTNLTDEYGFRVLYSRNAGSGNIIDGADMTFPISAVTDYGMRAFFDNLMTRSGSFETFVECLEQYGSVEVLSEPNVICPVLPNASKDEPYQAKITTGSKIPFEKTQSVGNTLAQVTDFRDIGVTLNVGVRKILNNRYIQLVVLINVKNLAGYVSVGTNKDGNPMLVPELTSREITNFLMAENEKTMITGLLVSEAHSTTSIGTPWISKIPILNFFFGNKKINTQRQELVFLLRPEIIYA
jgi:type IV pilus assembly protein PilQ